MLVYLAGGKSEWRQQVVDAFKPRPYGLSFIDPFKDSRQDCIARFTEDDLVHVGACDLLFAYIDYPVYTGTALEFGYARALNKTILYTCTLPRIDSMMVGVADAAFTDLTTAIEFMRDRYVAKMPPEPDWAAIRRNVLDVRSGACPTITHTGDSETCPWAIGKPRYCEECK